MADAWWVVIWDTINGEVAERIGPYSSEDEAWKALRDEVERMQEEGWGCEAVRSDPPGYLCQKTENEEHQAYWLTVEERPANLPP